MKNIFLMFFFCVFVLGCSYTDEDIRRVTHDPHFAQYQQKRDELESAYLQKKISYPDYLENKKRIDDTYSQEVQERETIIRGQ